MATDLERLVVQLSADIKQYQNAMNRANGITNKTARQIESRFDALSKHVSAGVAGIGRGIAGAFATAAALRGAQQLIDTSTRIENALKVAGLAGEDLEAVYNSLFQSAQRNAAPLESLVTLYGRAAIVQKELGVSTEELLGFTDNVALALRVAGTDAQTASGSLLQLSQALGAGTVRAEEFNSILEGALPIAQAVAAGLDEAGGSVAKLRGLVVEGKVSSEAFFRAFEAGSVILEEKVAGSELTVSQSFVRLQNVLVDTAGKFDDATKFSASFARDIDTLATAVERLSDSQLVRWLTDLNNHMEDANFDSLGKTIQEFEDLGNAIEAVVDQVQQGLDRYGSSISDATLELAQNEQALATFALNTKGKFGEIGDAAQDLFGQILKGRGTAESTAIALEALGEADPDFAPLLNKISGVVARIYELRRASAAATRVDVSGNAMSYAGQESAPAPKAPATVKTVSIADYDAPTGGGGAGGGRGKSAGDRFNDRLDAERQRLANLQEETSLISTLSPLIDDYGYAIEKLRMQQDLENEATRAGLDLTPDRVNAINELAEGYATATVEAARLAEAQQSARDTMEDWFSSGRDIARGFIDDLGDAKSAADALGNAFQAIGSKLLDLGLAGLFGTGSGSNPFGVIGKLFGFATGTANTGGRRGEPRGVVHGQEAVIPLPAGGKVPVDLRLPSLPSSTAGGAPQFTFAPVIDARGADTAAVEKLGQILARERAEFEPRVRQIVANRGKNLW